MGLFAGALPAVGPLPQPGQLYVLALLGKEDFVEELLPHVGQYADAVRDVDVDVPAFCVPQFTHEKESVRPL